MGIALVLFVNDGMRGDPGWQRALRVNFLVAGFSGNLI
jgi:hypothetical protein